MVGLTERQLVNIQEVDIKHSRYTGTIQLQEMRGTEPAAQHRLFSQGDAGCISQSRWIPAGSIREGLLRPRPEQGFSDSRHQKR